jgi:hypothetical protein
MRSEHGSELLATVEVDDLGLEDGMRRVRRNERTKISDELWVVL